MPGIEQEQSSPTGFQLVGQEPFGVTHVSDTYITIYNSSRKITVMR